MTILLGAAGWAPAQDLVRNGGFETAGSTNFTALYWEAEYPDDNGGFSGSAERVDWRSHSGSWQAALMGTWRGLGNRGEFWQEADAVPGLFYCLEGWFWADDGNPSGPWTAAEQHMRLEFRNQQTVIYAVTSTLAGVQQAWQTKSVWGQAPPGCTRVRAVICAEGIGSAGALQFDDLRLTEEDAPPKAPFPFFDGFESGGLSNYWTAASSSTNGLIRITTNGYPYAGTHLVALESATYGYLRDELVLTADLSGQTNVFLDCWVLDNGYDPYAMPTQFTGSTNASGIALSVDGTHWYRLEPLTGYNWEYTNVLADLTTVANAHSLSFDGPVQIKFQMYGYYYPSYYERYLDNVQLYSIPQAADVVLALDDAPDPVAVGSNLTYALSVSNAGPTTAENVFLTNQWPAGAILVSATANRGSWTTNGNTLVGELGSLARGECAAVTLVVQPQVLGTVTNWAEVSTSSTDWRPANNRQSASTVVDLVGGDLSFNPSAYAINENGGSVVLTVVRTGAVVGAISFDYETVDDTAQAGSDYSARSGTLTLANGETDISWTVPILNDAAAEGVESFSVRLRNPTGGAVLVAPSNATVQIRDEDGIATMPFVEDFESGAFANYWATYTTGTAGPQISTNDGPHGGVRHVNMNGDDLSYSLNEMILSADLSGREGVYLRFWHKRFEYESDNAMSDSFKNHAYADGVAISVDGTNWYKVHGLAQAETGTNEYRQFDVALDPILAAHGLGLTGRVRIKFQMYGYYYPPWYGRFFDDISLYTRGGDLRLSAPEGAATEAAGAVTVTVERVNGDSGEVSVDYATLDGTAEAVVDYGAATGTLVFSNGVRAQSIIVPIHNDIDDEPLETFAVQIFNPLGDARVVAPTQAVVTIADDDGPGELAFGAAQYAEQENNGVASIAVTRRYGNDGEMSVRWRTQAGTATPGADYIQSTGTVVFADGEAEGVFEIPLLDDALMEGPETIQLFLFNPEGGATLGLPTNAWLTLQDDEAPRAAFPFYEGFESGAWSNYWTVRTNGYGRIQMANLTNGFEGSRSLTMDATSGWALNEATLTVNLAGQTSVIFRCWTRDFSDTAQAMPETFSNSTNADGIAVSADGLTWYRLVDLAGLSSQSVYTNLVVDLAAFAAQQGLPLTATFQIRFQQYDNGAFPSRGRTFDHLSLTPAPPATSTVIRAQGFEGETGDTWHYWMAPGAGQIAVRPDRKRSGTRSLRMTGSNNQNTDPFIEFENVTIGLYNHVQLSVAFSASGPDVDDDLWLGLSYNNGASWGWTKLVDGYSDCNVPFGGINATNPTTVTNNPWIVEIPAGSTQVKTMLFYDERSGKNNINDHYYVDDVSLYYLPTNQPPMMEPVADQTALVSNRLEFAVVARDIDSNTVTLAASNLPAGAVFASVTETAPLTNLFVFTPDETQANLTYPVVFYVSDHDGYNAQTVTIRVLDRVVTFATNRLFTEEAAGMVAVEVSLSRAADATVPLAFAGLAGPETDCTVSSTSLNFTVDGPAQQTVWVQPLDDDLAEGPEILHLAVADNPQTTAGDRGCDVVIRDDDSVTVVSANLTSGGTAIYQEAGARIMQSLLADVVAIQEFNVTDAGGNRAFVDRVFGTNFYYWVEPAGALPNGVISRWPILAAGEWDDPQLTDRDFVWATVDVPGGRPLHVVSVHLHSSGGTSSRQIEAALLTNYLAQAGYHPADLVVLCGDLNTQNRSEAAWTTLRTFLSDAHRPTDQNGDPDTNQPRDKPYDVVLPWPYFDERHQGVRFGGLAFPEGLVFDTRLWSEAAIPGPAQVPDSSVLSMQHMGVEKLFGLDRFVTVLTQAGANGSVFPQNPEVGLGSNQTFTLTAAPYYHVSRVALNGEDWTPPSQPGELAWTWSNAQDNAWLDVSFAENLTGKYSIPERWLAANGITNDFDLAEEDDPDEDGMPTWKEYRANTRPKDPTSVLQFEEITTRFDENEAVLIWQSASNRVYSIWRSTNLADGFGLRIATNLPATPTQNVYTDQVEGAEGLFYRIELGP